jgi:hypothetical protein
VAVPPGSTAQPPGARASKNVALNARGLMSGRASTAPLRRALANKSPPCCGVHGPPLPLPLSSKPAKPVR